MPAVMVLFALVLLLPVVFFMIDLSALAIFGHLHVLLFVAADAAIGSRTRFHAVLARLATF